MVGLVTLFSEAVRPIRYHNGRQVILRKRLQMPKAGARHEQGFSTDIRHQSGCFALKIIWMLRLSPTALHKHCIYDSLGEVKAATSQRSKRGQNCHYRSGQHLFMKNIVTDIVLEPGLETAHIALHDIDAARPPLPRKWRIASPKQQAQNRPFPRQSAQCLARCRFRYHHDSVGGYEPQIIDFDIPKNTDCAKPLATRWHWRHYARLAHCAGAKTNCR